MIWSSEAPANIALIKYMGKSADNIPLNPSLSFTLDKFTSRVELELFESAEDEWAPDQQINPKDRERFLSHLKFLKTAFGIDKNFRVRSSNNFPSHCGLASSASSFAALTKCAAKAATELKGRDFTDPVETNSLSRKGSGSSCRSFFGPFSVWDREGARPLELKGVELLHQVVVVDSSRKDVSSSEAHKRVLSSRNWNGRPERAIERLDRLVYALKHNSWKEAFEITWDEFRDMHDLFETSEPAFTYMKDSSRVVLDLVRSHWDKHGDGPLVTMDAGPNIHLLYREDQREMCIQFRVQELSDYIVLGEGER